MKTIKQKINDLNKILKIQSEEPSIRTDSYMAGLYNGLLLAQVTLNDGEYYPISYHEHWLLKLARRLIVFRPFEGTLPLATKNDELPKTLLNNKK